MPLVDTNKHLPQLCNDKDCTGCLACVNACHVGALSITTNEEGYYRPLLDTEKCVKCNLCEKSCPIITPPQRNQKEDIKVYAAWHLDESIRAHSSSGGAFTALAEAVLVKGGIVYGAAWGENLIIEHIGVSETDGLEKLRLSKYAQSRVGEAMKKVKEQLVDGRQVLFVGTPCQAAGLKCFLRNDYDNLTVIDFICHGVPSIKFLLAYTTWLERKTGKIEKIVFRDKKRGWYDSLRVVTNDRGRDSYLYGKDDCFWVAFNNINKNLQHSCYQCITQGFPRCSDITLADFWGIGQRVPFGHKDEIEKGVSLIVINNAKGGNLLEEAKKSLFLEERTIEEAIGGNLTGVRSCAKPKSRDTIYQDLDKMDFSAFRKKYMGTSLKQDMVKIFRERLPYSIVKWVRLRNQK